jgi:hypothetical protein
MFNGEDIKEIIKVGNGESMLANKVVSMKRQVIQLDGSVIDITLHEVKSVPKLWVNFISINKALNNGYHHSNQGLSISLSKGSVFVTFDRVMRTTNCSLSEMILLLNESPVVYNTLSVFLNWDIAV